MSNENNLVIAARGISKKFPGVVALDNVSIEVRKGEVLALLGENGAGKSTLIKILSGIYQKDSGEIWVNGNSVEIKDPKHAQSLGISTIFQEPSLAPQLTAVQNVYLGREIVTPVLGSLLKRLNTKEMQKETEKLYYNFFTSVEDLNCPVSELGALKNRVIEIVKALSVQASVVIMDEPTAALAEHERGVLFDFVRLMKAHGVSVIYITHHLRELYGLVDRATIMRDGKNVATVDIKDVTVDQIVSMMVGRTLSSYIQKKDVPIGEKVLEVVGINREGILKDISLNIRKGEIVGISGLAGSGRTETVRAIIGADTIDSGKIMIDGKVQKIKSPKDAIHSGIGLLPENRKLHGALIDLPVKQNITLAAIKQVSRGKVGLSQRQENKVAAHYIQKLGIKTPSANQHVRYLSGGNQQKVILAKWLFTNPKVLIFDEPTQGIDVGAKVEVYKLISEFVENGGGVLLVSSELPELLGLCDRVYVMYKGSLVHEFVKEEATEENIMMYASGEHRN